MAETHPVQWVTLHNILSFLFGIWSVVHVHASCNAVTLVWGSLRLAPISLSFLFMFMKIWLFTGRDGLLIIHTVVSRKYVPPPPPPFAILALVQNAGYAGCNIFSRNYAPPSGAPPT